VPRYYFHLHDGLDLLDEEGKLLDDLAAARANAVREARQMMLAAVAAGRVNLSHRIDIADESGAVIATIAFRDAVTVEG
jgi:hypothetical protein